MPATARRAVLPPQRGLCVRRWRLAWTFLAAGLGFLAAPSTQAQTSATAPATQPAARPAAHSLSEAGKACTQPDLHWPLGRDWFRRWKLFKKDLEDKTGTSICLCIYSQNQVILNGPGQGKNRTVLWWNLNVTQKLWQDAKLIVNTRGGGGDGLGRYTGTKHSTNWMQAEPRCVYISHCLVEQKLFDDKLTLTLGKLDLGDYFDTNEAASWNFLSYSLARNPTVPCVWHAIGAVARYQPLDWFYVQAGVADVQGNWTETGLNTAFHDEDHTVSMYEFGLRPKPGGRRGNYRFILWYDPQPIGRVDGTGTERDDLGFAVSFDQQLTDGITGFFRYGYAHARAREIEHFWSLGATWTGPIAGRPKDVLGFGVAQAVMGDDYRRCNSSSSTETLFELYYKIKVNEWLSIAPDLQVILNPGATGRDVVVIAGVSVAMSF